MAVGRLFTHEDGLYFHVHKIIGALVLANFARCMIPLFRDGVLNLSSDWTFAWLAIHALLHVTSFQFRLQARRNLTYNIIWPEMRLHSMIFAYRSIAVCALIVMNERGILSSSALMYGRVACVFFTLASADTVTYLFAPIVAPTTTMRSNPFAPGTPQYVARTLNAFYSISQIFATMNVIFRGFGSNFLALVAIQTAPFGMTLVKKGVLRQTGWHVFYVCALSVSYIYPMIHANVVCMNNKAGSWYGTIAMIVVMLRMGLCVNKYAIWLGVALFALLFM
jgi:hypothetical protein